MTPHCASDACGQNSENCPTRQACGLPERRTFEPDYTISGPHRARNWFNFKLAAAVIGGLIIARLALRYFGAI